jgi:hypothetical protein
MCIAQPPVTGLENPSLAKDVTYSKAIGQPKFLSSIELFGIYYNTQRPAKGNRKVNHQRK